VGAHVGEGLVDAAAAVLSRSGGEDVTVGSWGD
jgi:hypothetical protein